MALPREIKAPLIGMGFLASIAYVAACFAFVESLDGKLPGLAGGNARALVLLVLVTVPAWGLFELIFRRRG